MPTKRCPDCHLLLPVESFAKSNTRSGGLQSLCRKCSGARQKRWQQSHRLEFNAYMRQWRADHKEKVAATNVAQYEKNKEKRKQHQREYYAENIQSHLARNRGRKAQKRDAPGSHNARDVADLLAIQEGKCLWCGADVGDDYHVDHMEPLSLGGSDGPENLAISCPDCNRKKHNKPLDEWLSTVAKSYPQTDQPPQA